MNIVHLVFNRVGQGTYWRSFFFGKWLVKMGHSVTLIATSPKNRWYVEESWLDGIHLIQTPDIFSGSMRSGWDLWNCLQRVIWLRQKHYDIVHAFEARPTVLLPALFLHEIGGVPLVMDWSDWFGRGGSVEQRPNPIIRGLLRPVETFFEEHFRTRANATTVICTVLKQRARELGVPEESIHMIRNGCNTENFFPIEPQDARRQLQLPMDGIFIGYVGTIFQSDMELMAQSFDRVVQQIPGARLILAGYFPYDLRQWTHYPESVIQTGPLDLNELRYYLSSCDLFWLPFRNTGANRGRWPLKINDYMSFGRPCVCTAVGDVKTFLEEEPIGLLSSDQPDEMADTTIRLIGDLALRDKMGKHARYLAESSWNWSEKTKHLVTVYQRLLSSRM